MSEIKTIGKDYNLKQLIKFVAAPVASRLVISLLATLDDGLFVSRYCGNMALAGFSIVLPLFMFIDGFGMLFMAVGTKSSMLLGEKKNDEANDTFTTGCLLALIFGILVSLTIWLFGEKIAVLLGATESLMPYVMAYINIGKYYAFASTINFVYLRFYTVCGKPKINVFINTVNMIINFGLDYLFIVRMGLGLGGAAYANMISAFFSLAFGTYFYSNEEQEIHFTKIVSKPLNILKEIIRLGKSSFLTNCAVSINTFVANLVLLKYSSENGVAAYTIMNNSQWMFMSMFFGLTSSISPLIAYAYGEKNKDKLVKLLKNSVIVTTGLASITFITYLLSQSLLMKLYLPEGSAQEVIDMARIGLSVSPFALFIFSYNCFIQEISPALSNDRVATISSTLENLVLINLFMILLPSIFGGNAVWYVFLITEIVMLVFTIYVVNKYKDVYGYGKKGIATFIEEEKK